MLTVQNMQPETAALLRQVFHNQDAVWPEGNSLTAEVFFLEVRAQGLVPLLFRQLRKEHCLHWPPELLARLRATALRQAAAELLWETDLRSVLQALAGISVAPLLLKGTALSYSLYPEPWLRPRCDTDLLIPVADREKTAALLQQLGYKPLHEASANWINSQSSWSQPRQGVDCRYDLHWQINNNSSKFSRNFTETTPVALPVLGEHAKTLNTIDALLLACFHRAGHFSHSGDQLIWLYDIHLLCQALTEQEAAMFHQKAKELEISSLCADAATAAQFWFNTTLPETFAAMLQEQRSDEEFSLFLQPGRSAGIRNHALLKLQDMATWHERLRFLWYNLFPPAEYMLWRYNKKNKFVLPLLYAQRCAEAVALLLKRESR
ncbi:nucleotidyltransferase family protein [Candidatus Electronema sp. PJ]|uniref:nucleotidyltransferase domain-containing protein n=1 Tax=Candidatus Electronema sp. PJ TaxID=3401572 RepID=UPI003AA9A559